MLNDLLDFPHEQQNDLPLAGTSQPSSSSLLKRSSPLRVWVKSFSDSSAAREYYCQEELMYALGEDFSITLEDVVLCDPFLSEA